VRCEHYVVDKLRKAELVNKVLQRPGVTQFLRGRRW